MSTRIETEDGGLLCTKNAAAEVIKAEGSSDIILLVSTEAVDSDGDIVRQRKSKRGQGWLLDRFNKAPVITWQHDMWVPNLSGPKTKAKVQKHPNKGFGLHLNPLIFDDGDDMAMTIEGKIRRGVLKESSVQFKIVDRESIKNDEGRTTGLDIGTSELIEVAIANRGANPETEVMAKRMLTRADVASQVEGGGSAEVQELKEEIQHLAEKFDLLANVVKAFGDDAEAEEFLRKQETQKANQTALKAAATELLKSLRTVGTAR